MRSALVLGSLILAVLTIETGMRAYGHLLKSKRDRVSGRHSDIRILAIGESTTDPALADGGKTWTHFLREKIQKSLPGKSVEIVNQGKSGASTEYILAKLPGWIETHRPQLIISMMGINDIQGYEYREDEHFFAQMKTVKLINWWWKSLSAGRKISVAIPTLESAAHLKEILRNSFALKSLSPEVRLWIRSNPQLEWYALKEYGVLITAKMESDENLRKDPEIGGHAFSLLERALELNPRDNVIVENLLYHSPGRITRTALALKKAIHSHLEPNDYVLSTLSAVKFLNDPELERFTRNIIRINDDRPIDQVQRNHQRLAELTLKNGIALAVMSYPTVDEKIIRLFFDPGHRFPGTTLRQNLYQSFPEPVIDAKYSSLIFIDNSGFPRNHDPKYFTDAFVDTPRGGFGHTTGAGHEKIAETAFQALRKTWLPKIR